LDGGTTVSYMRSVPSQQTSLSIYLQLRGDIMLHCSFPTSLRETAAGETERKNHHTDIHL